MKNNDEALSKFWNEAKHAVGNAAYDLEYLHFTIGNLIHSEKPIRDKVKLYLELVDIVECLTKTTKSCVEATVAMHNFSELSVIKRTQCR